MEAYVWWKHKDVSIAFYLVRGTFRLYRAVGLPRNVLIILCFYIINGLPLDKSSRESYFVGPRKSSLRRSLLLQPPEAYKRKTCVSHIAQAHPARGLMGSIFTISANQLGFVETLINRMRNTRKHHHPVVLKGVIASATRKIWSQCLRCTRRAS